MQEAYDTFLFDLYGTLVDIHTDEEAPALWSACAKWMDKTEYLSKPELLHERYLVLVSEEEAKARHRRGDGAEIDLQIVFRRLLREAGMPADDSTVRRFAAFFRAESTRKLRVYPGAAELLQAIRRAGKRAYLLSNAQPLFTRPELDRLGLTPLFDGILLSGEAGYRKPDPRFYRAMLALCRSDPARTVMIGNDDEADCQGAAAVGLDSCYLHTEQSPRRVPLLPPNCRILQSIGDTAALIG